MSCAGQGVSRKFSLNAKRASSSFAEWASLFSGELFVKAVAYVDESGTHDRTGVKKGAAQVVVAGLVDWRDNWIKFCDRWESVLVKYSAPYFHFKEWSAASRVVRGVVTPNKDFKKNPYRQWSLETLNAFLLELAEIAGDGNKIVVGVWVETADFHKAATNNTTDPKTIPAGGDPYRHCLDMFFKQLPADILTAWPDWKQPVSIFYDWTDDPAWRRAITDAHDIARRTDARIRELTFANKKDRQHFPLQAADMVVYRFRQLAETYRKGTIPRVTKLDERILNSMFKQFDVMLGKAKSRHA
jgi:Protein of unknown function (DUF3800)